MRATTICPLLLLAVPAVVGVPQAAAAAVAVEGLSVTIDDAGRVSGLEASGMSLLADTGPTPLVSLCDVTKGDAFVPGTPTGGNLADGLRVDFAGAQASAVVKCVAGKGTLHFTCDLSGPEGLPARGVLLRFAFPLDCVGWRWHDDMQTTREIAFGQVYENVRALRAWADLPEWADKPALRMGYSNRNFCTVLTGPAGVCLSVPLDRPRIFRTAYDAQAKQLQLLYDLALSPDTREPNACSFAFDLYPCDPNWGFRSALARYYRLYPDLFTNYVPKPGQWMAFTKLSSIDNANEFYFGLQEGAPEPEYDDKIGVLSCPYFTHAGQFANIPDYDPEKDPLPSHDVLVKTMSDTFKRRTGIEGIYEQVGLYNAEEKLDIRKTRVYGHIIAQFNLDPDLPYGDWHLKRTATRTKSTKDQRGGILDGFYYDGLTSGINYRREHFRYAAAPPLWDPVAKKPLLNNFFSACEFARAAAELLRPRGQITMMNGALGASCFVAPWLDVFGSETGVRISREGLNYIRSIVYQKPYVTLLKGNYEQKIGRGEMELFMKRALAYGIFPGFFDWPPSGLGPGGRYWAHAEYYERDRDLHRRYQPLCQTLALAGWQPVTFARSSNEQVFVERFGPGDDGIVWLTLLNEDGAPHTTRLTLDAKGLALDVANTQCVDVLSGKAVDLRKSGGVLSADIEVASDGVAMLQLCTAQQAAVRRLDWAVDAVERGLIMREVDAKKPPLAVHWRAQKEPYGRRQDGPDTSLVFDGTERGAQDCTQWAMLFQPEAAPVKLTVRAAGTNLAGEGNVRLHCNAAWVSASYTHYEKHSFDLPKGTYAPKDFEFTIECDQPLRAIALTPQMDAGVTGRLEIASLRLEDRFANDYVVDPEFDEWYEPVPVQMRERLARDTAALRDALARARSSALANLTTQATREALIDLGARCSSLRTWIVDAKAENGCRRALRDVETVEQQAGGALLASLGVPAPQIVGPVRAAPGDAVSLTFSVPAVRGVDVRTELTIAGEARRERARQGTKLTIPNTAAPGTRIEVVGTAHIGSPGRSTAVRASHTIEVVAPLELGLSSSGADPESGALHVHATVRNNRTRPLQPDIEVAGPGGWRGVSTQAEEIPAGGSRQVDLTLTPAGEIAAGLIDVHATATAGNDVARASKTVLHIPKEANLLRNAGFENGGQAWAGIADHIAIDPAVAHSGQASVRVRNATAIQSTLNQSVTLNQKQPCALLVRAASRGENVSGPRGRGYSLYVDLYYTDGTPLYGQTYDFETGTTEWQLGELCIEPEKPIRNVNVYLLLRGKSGTVWFDDVAVMEDPRRKGNFAREATVTVDSSYSQYHVGPLTDGILYPSPDAHWTDESWASSEANTDHFVELTFPEPRELARAVIYWSMDAGEPRTSAEVQLQMKEGDTWRTVATAEPTQPAPQTVIGLEAPVTSSAFRLLQPKGKGPDGRANLMWVREVELFPPK